MKINFYFEQNQNKNKKLFNIIKENVIIYISFSN